ncbi:hypothetical protein [Klebsiella sp. 2680]|uniref:hypothetical protein n=1 Tax=Klebsiella sp. 2680 TaxID=2018037 RepID=UPI00115705E1|nr:hypothetical protein [Klebsiella sp. 2680]
MTSRDQFESWWESERYDEELSRIKGGIMFNRIKANMFLAWQASRNVEIDLPDKVFAEDDFDTGHNCGIDYCVEAIRSAGFKVKGG